MRIDSIYLRDVGPFDEVTIPFPEGTDPNLADVYLLTGPNGCGKSTVLYAIAAALVGHHKMLGPNLVQPRLRGKDSLAVIKMGDARRAVAHERAPSSIPDPFGGPDLRASSIDTSDGCTYLHVVGTERRYEPTTYGFAFAYAGSRTMQDAHVVAIQEMTDKPLENSLAFDLATDTKRLVHWIANQEFKRLKAKDANDLREADSLYEGIRSIERIVADVIDDPSFAFVHGKRDNDVRIRRYGEEVELRVLPAGVQSIVSWVADLLMRLERSPWIDATSSLQRPFVLLLDEIDIHLHPAWQRKVLRVAQKMFPKAQIIASTHSPFVVASAEDAHVIPLVMKEGKATLDGEVLDSQRGVSYSALLRGLFGISSEFDIMTEEMFDQFRAAKIRLLQGATNDRVEVDALARQLAERSEEAGRVIGYELRQLDRQLAQRAAG